MKKWILILTFIATLNPPCHADNQKLNQNHFFVDLLIWRIREASSDNWAQTISPSGPIQNAKLINAPFQWRPGLRIGVGHNQGDIWNANLYYTGYRTKASTEVSGRVFSAFLGNFFANNTSGASTGPSYQSAHLLWSFDFHTLDFLIGHQFQIDQAISINPFVGLKGAIINQNIRSNWFNPVIPTNFSSAQETLKQDFSGIGPALGVNTDFHLLHGKSGHLNLFADVASTILWGHWRFKDRFENNQPINIKIINSDINGASTMIQTLVGLEWLTQIKQVSVKAHLGYEAQVWFNHMQIYSFNMGRLNHLMSIQGGVFGLNICG